MAMTWLIYGAVGYVVYKLAKGGKLGPLPVVTAPKKKKRKKKTKRTRKPDVPRAPHEVLGVEPDASAHDVRHAYQELMRKYHPDRVANAADELRALATKRSKEINAAYDFMKQRV